MLNLSPSEYKMLAENSDAQTAKACEQEVVSLQAEKQQVEVLIEKLQEEARKLEQKISDKQFEIKKANGQLRLIQVAYIKSRGYDPGELPIAIQLNEDGSGKVIIG